MEWQTIVGTIFGILLILGIPVYILVVMETFCFVINFVKKHKKFSIGVLIILLYIIVGYTFSL